MDTIIGIGHSNQTNSRLAGSEAALQAIASFKNIEPDFALVFCGGKHDVHEFLNGVNEHIPNVKKAGGSSFGIISNGFVGYDGFEVGITMFKSDKIKFDVYKQGDINVDEYSAGFKLGKEIEASFDGTEKGLFIFYDSSKQQSPPMLNFATPLCLGLAESISNDLPCAGGGFLADMMLSTCYQIVDNEILTQHVLGIKISGDCQIETSILHGCKPCSDYITITKTQGPLVLEIENTPAISYMENLMNKSIQPKDFPMNLTLGINRGDKFDDFKESDYANRLTLAIDEPSGALVMFEPDLQEGDEVQLMRRDFDANYIGGVIESTISNFTDKKPSFGFYINCGGRAKPFSGVNFEDANEVFKQLPSIPFSGFYSGVEVAKVGDKLQPLDWTGVLFIIGE